VLAAAGSSLFRNEVHDALDFVSIEPDSVAATQIDHDPRTPFPPGVLTPLHEFAAGEAGDVVRRFERLRSSSLSSTLVQQQTVRGVLRSLRRDLLEGRGRDPQSQTLAALDDVQGVEGANAELAVAPRAVAVGG